MAFVAIVRQLRKVHGDPPGLVLREPLGDRTPAWLVVEVEIAERLPVGVADDEGLSVLLDGPER
jgi:hypothetical protein